MRLNPVKTRTGTRGLTGDPVVVELPLEVVILRADRGPERQLQLLPVKGVPDAQLL